MLTRVLALLAAVGMVAGAVVARDWLDERNEKRSTTLNMVCSTELAAVCTALADEADIPIDVTVEAAAETASRLATATATGGASAALDGWLVARPWVEIVEGARQRGGLPSLLNAGPTVARTPVVLVVWRDRAEVLTPRCGGGGLGWQCVGNLAGKRWSELGGGTTWGAVKPGHPDVATGAGLAVLGAATAGYFTRTDLVRVDLDDDGFTSWLAQLEQSVPARPSSPFADMLVKGPSAFDVVGVLEAEAAPALATSARRDALRLIYPPPVATADLVLATPGGARASRLADVVRGAVGQQALAGAGWRVTGDQRRPLLPPDDNMPPAGVLDALREVAQ